MKTIKKISNIVVMAVAITFSTNRVQSQTALSGTGSNSCGAGNAGTANTFVGCTAGGAIQAGGNYNTAIGENALNSVTTGDDNTAVGFEAGEGTHTGSRNSYLGYQAGFNVTNATDNTFIGNESGFANRTGIDNACLGSESGYYLLNGNNNTFLGKYSGRGTANFSSSNNTFIGYRSGTVITSGDENLFAGGNSGAATTTGFDNTFIGFNAGLSNTTANYNVYVGHSSGRTNTTGGHYNAFLGMNTGFNNTASYNTFVGHNAGIENTTGYVNTFVGYVAGFKNTTGLQNTFIGTNAGHENTVASLNTFVGLNAGYNNTSSWNTALGAYAGDSYATCTLSTFIGYNADANGNYANCTAIGNGAVATASNRMYFGNANVLACHNATGLWTSSDGRFKFNVNEDVAGLEFIKRLRPVTYQLNTQEMDGYIRQNMPETLDSTGNPISEETDFTTSMSVIHSGFIAQEVQEAALESGFTSSIVSTPANATDLYAVNYAQMVVPLVKAVQEQQAQIEELKAQLSQCCALGSSKTDEDLRDKFNSDNATVVELRRSDDIILYQNIPNPFGDETIINFYCMLSEQSGLKVSSFNVVFGI